MSFYNLLIVRQSLSRGHLSRTFKIALLWNIRILALFFIYYVFTKAARPLINSPLFALFVS